MTLVFNVKARANGVVEQRQPFVQVKTLPDLPTLGKQDDVCIVLASGSFEVSSQGVCAPLKFVETAGLPADVVPREDAMHAWQTLQHCTQV